MLRASSGLNVHHAFRYADDAVIIEVHHTRFGRSTSTTSVLDVVARTSRKEVKRYKVYGHAHRPTA